MKKCILFPSTLGKNLCFIFLPETGRYHCNGDKNKIGYTQSTLASEGGILKNGVDCIHCKN